MFANLSTLSLQVAVRLCALGRYSPSVLLFFFFFSSRRRHTRFKCDWSSDVCSSDLFGASLSKFQRPILTANFDRLAPKLPVVCAAVRLHLHHCRSAHASKLGTLETLQIA